jgi:cytidylate kinase
MNNSIETVDEMRAITISREYGSGGGEIAARLAQRLGWQVIDHAMVERVARALGTSQEEAGAHNEHPEGALARLLNGFQYINPAFTAYAPPGAVSPDEAYRDAVERIVRAAAARGRVVIVGRGAQVLLAAWRDVLRVRIIAPLEQRIAYVMQREGLEQRAAASRIRQKEHERTRYLEAVYHRKPDEAHLYDIVLNMSILDPASAVNVICLTLNHMARRLCAQTGVLGPATGLSRYPGQPRDFRPKDWC